MIIAMGIAGAINMAMLITASAVFHTRRADGIGDDLRRSYDGLGSTSHATRTRSSGSRCSRRGSPRRRSGRSPARS